MVDTASKNYLTIALEEVANGKIKYHYEIGAVARWAAPTTACGSAPGL